MADIIALGQRELTPGEEFVPSLEEALLLDKSLVTPQEVQSFIDLSEAKMTINAAIGGLKIELGKPPFPNTGE